MDKLNIYQDSMFDCVENLRELEPEYIASVFDWLYANQFEYVADIIIMFWSLPRFGSYRSRTSHDIKYEENIRKYNPKIISIINNNSVMKFCIDTLSKTNSVPIHCIDFLWFYSNGLVFDVKFINRDNRSFLTIEMSDDNSISLGFNLLHILELGLGNIQNRSTTLVKMLIAIITNNLTVKSILKTSFGKVFKDDLVVINNNTEKYFDDNLISLPNDVVDQIK